MLLLAAMVAVQAQDAPADKPKDKKPSARLTQPWNKISSLSDEQKTQIREIHAKAVAEKKAIDEKEQTDILALLNDDQKAEAQKLIDEKKSAPKPAAAKEDATASAAGEKKAEEKKE
jgi:Spy/CpxP family protein refolding chaperone